MNIYEYVYIYIWKYIYIYIIIYIRVSRKKQTFLPNIMFISPVDPLYVIKTHTTF